MRSILFFQSLIGRRYSRTMGGNNAYLFQELLGFSLNRFSFCLFLVFIFGLSVLAQENQKLDPTPRSPPLLTDDPGTPGPGIYEINLSFSGEITQTKKNFEVPLFDFNRG